MIYVNLIVTTKQKLIVNTQKKKMKESKHNIKECDQNTREDKKIETEELRKQPENKVTSTYPSIIILYINGLNSPIKRCRVA